MSATLILQFAGWCLIRLPTDPDPPDEPRGVSGYTFAFAGEPDLDRVIHLQPPTHFTLRSYSPPIGVQVRRALRQEEAGQHELPALQGARVELLDQPRLENRNWTLTLPGYEPIVPFHLSITQEALVIRRQAPLDPQHPDRPLWEIDSALIQAQGARGMEYEPETIGQATGIWDTLAVAKERLAKLKADRERLRESGDDPVALTALEGRIHELEIAVNNPGDRRTFARNFVERFGFPLQGEASIQGDQAAYLGGRLDPTQPWNINFWLGAWDPDLLCAYMQGALEIPYH